MSLHCSNDDHGTPHVRLTIGDRWIEIEHDREGWAWATSDGEVCERRSSADATAALSAFAASS